MVPLRKFTRFTREKVPARGDLLSLDLVFRVESLGLRAQSFIRV